MPGPSAVHDGPRLHLRLPALRRPHGTTAWPPGSRMPGAAQPDTRLSRVVRRSTGERRVRGQRRNREKRPGGRRMRAARRCSNTWRTTEPARSNGTALICARQATQDGVRHVVGYVDNIQDERALRWKAEHDSMTGLVNHATAERLVNHALADPEVRRSSVCAIIDIDDFKQVNDSRGHIEGDALLREIGVILRDNCRATDVAEPHGRRRVRPAARTHRAAGGVAAPGRDGGPHQRQHGRQSLHAHREHRRVRDGPGRSSRTTPSSTRRTRRSTRRSTAGRTASACMVPFSPERRR